MAKEIRLLGKHANSQVAIVDDDMYDGLTDGWRWYTDHRGYALGRKTIANGFCLHAYMHSVVVRPPDGTVVDHINGNPLDNRRENLRVCLIKENVRNSPGRGGLSRFKGVSWNKQAGKWQVAIRANGQRIYLGIYEDELEAASVYNEAAKKYFGEFAYLNVLDESNKNEQISTKKTRKYTKRSKEQA